MLQVDPMQLIQMIKSGKNPQQLLLNVMEGPFSTTPFGKNILDLAKRGDSKGIEQVARNFYAQQGKNFDQEFNAFKQ